MFSTYLMSLPLSVSYLNPVYTHQPIHFIVKKLLRVNRIELDYSILFQKLSEHPHRRSLLGISDVLNDLGVTHTALRITIETLSNYVNQSMLVHLTIDGGIFGVIKLQKNNKVKVITESGEKKYYSIEQFSNIWNGIILQIDSHIKKNINSANKNGNYPIEIQYLIAVSWALILLYFIFKTITTSYILQNILLFLNICGIGISWLAVLQHFNKKNNIVQKLCKDAEKEGCESVLNDSTANLTPWLSMADLGFIFFAGNVSLLLVFASPLLYFYIIFSAPLFSIYAILLQGLIIKKWCKLCMLIHLLVLALVVVSSIHFFNLPYSGLTFPAFEQFICFLFPGLTWFSMKPLIKILKRGSYFGRQFHSFKFNPDYFRMLLSIEEKVTSYESFKYFSFGNSKAKNELVLVSNPFCDPCAVAHQELHNWLQDKQLDLKVTIIFKHDMSDMDPRRKFVEFITGIDDKQVLLYLLNDWFNDDIKNLELWAAKHKLVATPIKYNEAELLSWFYQNKIDATPTVLVNSRKFPEAYEISTTKYLINEL